ncbi:polymer-forming cytoskeletal protein [Mixta tenebrionis]|uniref:Polymer-forming cytoskeletal protein n=2 Tax=Mixta tenebrionis TaxID=2562439 RepID=A0A506VET7_9GAMM|nr:polymer-forming cytoskeletal protein [Mixta tenebrionis]
MWKPIRVIHSFLHSIWSPGKAKMDRQYVFFNTGLCFWFLGLITSFYSSTWTVILGLLAAGSFLLYVLQRKVFRMFRKQNKPAEVATEKEIAPLTMPVEKVDFDAPQPQEKISNTVVARDVCFEGNITAVGQVYVYGEVQGNITVKDGLVKVMRNGLVNGNITCLELIINGNVQGECKAQSIDIDEHANIHGTLNYEALSVKKGGIFVGSADTSRKSAIKTNVIGLTASSAASESSLTSEEKKESKLAKK